MLLGYSLFLAVVPQELEAQRIAARGAALRRLHGLDGWCLPAHRLHITLHALAAFGDRVERSVVDAAVAAMPSVTCAAFPIVFDRAGSFRNDLSAANRAFVLQCDASSAASVSTLRQLSAAALRRNGLRPQPSSTPHMTMAYDRRPVAEHPIDPLSWTATRIVLILSHQGLSHHEWLGEWPLR